MRLTGFVADPACDRGNAKLQYLFVNGRWIRDRSLGHALQEAFRGLLMTGRYAVGFLFLQLPPDQVDVNVHPTKAEVRFRDSQAMYHLVRGAVKRALTAKNLVPRLQVPESRFEPMATAADIPPPGMFSRPAMPELPVGAFPATRPSEPEKNGVVADSPPTEGNHTLPAAASAFPARAIQIHDAYLVVETRDGMLVVDQHALHERILYEQLRDSIA